MNKFQTGEKWLRSDGKVCVIKVWDDNSISDQDGLEYTYGGYSYRGLNLVSRVVSDDELVADFIATNITGESERMRRIALRLQAQSKLLEELKQLISESQVKGAAMITKIEEL